LGDIHGALGIVTAGLVRVGLLEAGRCASAWTPWRGLALDRDSWRMPPLPELLRLE